MNVEDIFGIPVGIFTLTSLNCTKVIDYIENQNLIGSGEVEGEYTSNQQILEDSIFKETKEEIREATLRYSREAVGHSILDLDFSTSWANITDDNKHIRRHSHANSYISGCFYLNQGSNINLHNPIKKKDMYTLTPTTEFNANNKYTWDFISITPEPNMLIIFPSGLAHSVDPSPTRRHSVAFNTMPLGLVGRVTSLLNIKELDNT